MNKKYKKILNDIQLITTNPEGEIIFNDNNLFPEWSDAPSIFDTHPFFEIINSLDKAETFENTFSSVHFIDKKGEEKICDVKISFENSEIDIVIFDYTKTYNKLKGVSQERNQSIIKSQELEFYNRLLVEKEEFKNRFIANINHEIATPLTSIQGFLDLLKKTNLDYEQDEIIKFLKSESEHLKAVFNDMLDISQIESGKFKLNKEPFDFIELVNSIGTSYQKLITESDNPIDFSFEIDSKINSFVNEDRTRVYQILTNLLNNSIKYTDEGSIKLSLKKISGKHGKQEIEISIKDTGQGISKEDQEKIFESFSQISEAVNGIGLGLSVTKSLVHLMEGTMEVKSDLGKGSEFVITLKFLSSKKLEDIVDSLKKEKNLKLPGDKKFRILIVENRLNTQYLIMKQLLRNGRFFVDAADSAEDALKNIESRRYDLMILDIKLPGMSGIELAKFIRKKYSDSFIKEIPILGVSGISDANITTRAISAGMDAFMSKPYSQDVLINKVIRLLIQKEKV